jgi:hypothetical protein
VARFKEPLEIVSALRGLRRSSAVALKRYAYVSPRGTSARRPGSIRQRKKTKSKQFRRRAKGRDCRALATVEQILRKSWNNPTTCLLAGMLQAYHWEGGNLNLTPQGRRSVAQEPVTCRREEQTHALPVTREIGAILRFVPARMNS